MAYNFAVDAGVIADVDASLEALWQTTTGINGAAARARQDAFRAQKQADDAAQKARVEKAWSRTPTSMARVMAELEGRRRRPTSIVVDETITANLDLFKTFTFADAGRLLQRPRRRHRPGRGGRASAWRWPSPGRPILCISGDGSSMYSIQALWTAAHHDLPIVFVILANREYRVLKHNIDAYRARFDVKSNKPYMHMDLSGPTMGFVDLAKGMGVAGTHVAKADDIQKAAVAAAFKSGKPHLIEIEIEGKR